MAPSSAPKSNVALLTEGASYIRRKQSRNAVASGSGSGGGGPSGFGGGADRKGKGAKGKGKGKATTGGKEEVEKVVFDDSARSDFLTGFHKRKQAKITLRRTKAKERDKEEHKEEVRKARRELRERAAENFRSARRAMGLDDLEDVSAPADGATGVVAGTSSSVPKEQEEAFSDDEQQATVVITDDFDDALLGTGTSTSANASTSATPYVTAKPVPLLPASSRRMQKKAATEEKRLPRRKDKLATAKEYGSFETKAERKKAKGKEQARRKEKWELAKDRPGKNRSSSVKKGLRKGKPGKSAKR